MDNSKDKLLHDVKKELCSLENAFYDGMPLKLMHDEHIIQFCHSMEVIHSRIIMLIGNDVASGNLSSNASIFDNKNEIQTSNIDYSQLAAFASTNNISKRAKFE